MYQYCYKMRTRRNVRCHERRLDEDGAAATHGVHDDGAWSNVVALGTQKY